MSAATVEPNDHIDDHVDSEIAVCLDLDKPRSFFLFAGAGSGKTQSLVASLQHLRGTLGERMRLHGQQVAVITYTNAACDEITRRLSFDPLIAVSTIHSFVWRLIKGFNADIRVWLKQCLENDIAELTEEQRKGRPGTKAAADRTRSIELKQTRLDVLNTIKRFTYNPNGDNRGRDSLSHAEVIKIGADFLMTKPLMQRIVIGRFPFLLIDESQDTNRLLMEAFLALQSKNRERFCLGLFGDTMQRIYGDGKTDLGQGLPADWDKPVKVMNHRCPRRVVGLINKIRSEVDSHSQQFRTDSPEGRICLFTAEISANNRDALEDTARRRMADVTKDAHWLEPKKVKTLTLEHHMAARRMNFAEMFEPLRSVDDFATGLLDGTLPLIRLFSAWVLPLVSAQRSGNAFKAASVLRKGSPLLDRDSLQAAGTNQLVQLEAAKAAVKKLMSLWSEGAEPNFLAVLQCLAATKLFEIPEALQPFVEFNPESTAEFAPEEDEDRDEQRATKKLEAIRAFLSAPFSQIEPYAAYVSGQASYGTHQGVKGLQFPRVFVIVDDDEAKGFMFTYEKLFGVKEKTTADFKNELAGKDTSVARTRRLLYVTCSRTQQSLALMVYSSSPPQVRNHVVRQGWFKDDEIVLLH
jgi:DNA helicase-2/ATP-dependent DNA helicase PcrA